MLAIIISDVATRDLRSGTILNLRAVPLLREHFVWWKVGSTAILSVLFCGTSILTAAGHAPGQIVAMCIGIFFVVALASGLGVLTSNPKAFIVGFLSFGYIVVNDHGSSPMLDFAGTYGSGSQKTMSLYLALGVVALVLAQISYRRRLQA
jgi:hypothetical protein